MEWLTYDVLRLIWWGLLGVLLIGFAVLGGNDLGVGALLPFVARNDAERRVTINSIGPTWEGNQVWFILGGGAVFAAFPALYAAAFSGFYFAMLLILIALILRPVGFDFRNKLSNPRWRAIWDLALFIGGAVPALLFGVAFGNLFLGVPFHFDSDLRFHFDGGFFLLLRPFALLCGVVSLGMLATQGAAFLSMKTDGGVQRRAQVLLPWLALITLIVFAIGGLWLAKGVEGFRITSAISGLGPSDPLLKTVERNPGGWLVNYQLFPLTALAPVIAMLALLIAALLRRFGLLAFGATSLAIVAIVITAGCSLFPFFLTSSSHPDHSLTLWDASSSALTLKIMLLATLVFMPLILLYTAWVFRVLRGKVSEAYVKDNSHSLY